MNAILQFRLLIFVVTILIPLTSNACSCGHSEPEDYISGINLIFKGKVLSVEAQTTSDGELTGRTRAKFKMLVSYKGPVLKTVEISYAQGDGVSCGWSFTEGKEVTVFAYGNTTQGFSTSMCVMIPYASAMEQHDMTFQSAIEAYRVKRTALLKPPVTVKRLREQAAFFIKYLDYEDAEAAFNKLLAKQPKDITTLMGRADVYYQLKRYEQALADYRTVISLAANHQEAHHRKTLTLLKLGRMNALEPQDRDFSGYEYEYNEPKPSFAGLDLADANFSRAKLNEIDFSGADLTNADFSDARLRLCNFTDAKLAHAKFHKVNEAYGTQFNNADLQFVDFSEGMLRFSHLDNAVLDNADFSNASMESSFFEKVASMQGTKFSSTDFIAAKLKGIKFDGYDLSNADFRAADLRDSRFSNSQLNGATFGTITRSTDLKGADLSAANLTGVKWDGLIIIDCRTKFPKNYDLTAISFIASWAGCEGVAPKSNLVNLTKHRWSNDTDAPSSNFSDLELSSLEFNSGYFDGSDFSNTTLKSVVFGNGSYQHTNFENAKLNNVRLYNVNFSGTSFAHAELSEVSLDNVDFSNANFDGVVMTDVVFDEKTKFPEGFDPLAAGAKKKVH